ncbi:vgr related protein [Sphingomonas sp.]|uniref:vgr related protein n=1 Tax=Sphingomonas sp. TaxID=28214 RepID=UPI003D6D1479
MHDDTITAQGTGRPLTAGEVALARSMYHDSIDLSGIEIRRRKWFFLQPRNTVMAPSGHVHFHPHSDLWREDFSTEDAELRGLFLHELCHVWQTQRGLFLPLKRHPFCRYDYAIRPGLPFHRYGIEQQAEIVRHAFLLRCGRTVTGAPDLAQYETILPFGRRNGAGAAT